MPNYKRPLVNTGGLFFGEIPVIIPNTAVKPQQKPIILRKRETRKVPNYKRPLVNTGGLFFGEMPVIIPNTAVKPQQKPIILRTAGN